MTTPSDWNAVGQRWLDENPQPFWRRLHNELNLELLGSWTTPRAQNRVLKTDLFDEVVGDGLLPWFDNRTTTIGMDCASKVAFRARRKGRSVLVADSRRLPYRPGSLDLVVSNSTLDHFESMDEVQRSLGELRQALRPGGRLILTMDNLANPVVGLRNRLPFTLLQRLGIIPYPMGATGGPRALRRVLEEQGFDIVQMRAVSHVPRLPAVVLAGWLERLGWARGSSVFRRLVLLCEILDQLPTRYLTGYYVALLAEVPVGEPPPPEVRSEAAQ